MAIRRLCRRCARLTLRDTFFTRSSGEPVGRVPTGRLRRSTSIGEPVGRCDLMTASGDRCGKWDRMASSGLRVGSMRPAAEPGLGLAGHASAGLSIMASSCVFCG